MSTTHPAPPRPDPVEVLAGLDDEAGRTGVRRMKYRATGLLGLAAAIFLATYAMPETTAVGYLRAAAEAAVVGGVADWFAVTALFRHPLGLRVPHTALVPRKKDELATKLGEFVAGNFITPDAVAAHVTEARLVQRAGERLADPQTAEALARELARTTSALLSSVDADNAAGYVLELVRKDLARRSYAPVLGRLLATAVEGRAQHPIVDLIVRHSRAYLERNRAALHPQVRMFLERQGVLVWLFTTDRRVDELLDTAIVTLAEMERDGTAHPLRRWLDGLLTRFAEDLGSDPSTGATVDSALRALAYDPRVEVLTRTLVADVLESVRQSLDDAEGDLEHRLARMVGDVGRRIGTDAEFAARLEATLEQAVRYVVGQYGDQIVRLIQTQVAAWDPAAATERIETAVGRDLQFIRINGTVVGALVGLVIHAVALGMQRL